MTRLVCLASAILLGGCYHYHFSQCHDEKWGVGGKVVEDLSDPSNAQSRYSNSGQLVDEMRECRNDTWTYMSPSEMNGIDRAIYPVSKSARYASRYVQMGQVYEKRGDLDAGALAYWSALTLTRHTYADRPSREQIKMAAFEGLARIARSQGQANWTSVLSLCAELSAAYLRSAAADADSERFMAERDHIDRAVRGAIDAENAANQSLAMQSFGMQMQAQSGRMTLNQAANGVADLAGQRNTIDDSAARASAQTSAVASQLGAALADDVSEVETGKSFLWAHIASYLKVDSKRTLKHIQKAAESGHWDPVSDTVAKIADPSDPSDDELEALAKALHDVEVQAVHETRRKAGTPSPEHVAGR